MITSKEKQNRKTLSKLFFLIGICLLFFFLINRQNESEINQYGITTIASVKNITYRSYRNNAKEAKTISFYEIDIEYNYKGQLYKKNLQLQTHEFHENIKENRLKIMHSSRNPEKLKIIPFN